LQDKLNLVYEKAFSAVGARDWFHFEQWESMIDGFGLSESDSLWVIEQVEVKKFKYSVYQRVDGTFSATPTPVGKRINNRVANETYMRYSYS
jgi:hypothetical protein